MSLRLNSFAAFACLGLLGSEALLAGLDDASRYTPGSSGVTRWMSNGHRGDIEFGVWSFEAGFHQFCHGFRRRVVICVKTP
jgi:hypothetical protein